MAREKKLRLDGLMPESKDPSSLAFRIGQILAFGPDHPYGRVELPTTVERITRQDLAQFYVTYWKPSVSRSFSSVTSPSPKPRSWPASTSVRGRGRPRR